MTADQQRPPRELSPAEVRALAEAAGLPLDDDDDLAEITHRVNAFLEALAPLSTLPLATVEPLPIAPDAG